MGNEDFQDEAFRQFQKDATALARMSGQEPKDCSDYEPYFRAHKAALESTSENESESIESLPANGYAVAVQRFPLEVGRLRDDDDPTEWNRSVSWATNPLNVVNPHFVRRSERRIRSKANTGKTV